MKKLTALILTVLLSIAVVLPVTATEFTQPATTSSYTVTVYFTGWQGLALKTAPSESAGTYLNIPEGTQLHIDQVSSGFGQVRYNGTIGWVSLRYTRIVGDYPTPQPSFGWIDPTYYTIERTEGEGLELRTAPTTDASTFGPLYDGEVLKAEARSGEWVYGEHNGHYGWCHTHYTRPSYEDEINRYELQHPQIPQAVPETQAIPFEPVVPDTSAETLPADNGYARAYIDVLNSHWDEIAAYDWQNDTQPTSAVALSDIYGDEIPELLYISISLSDEAPYQTPKLHIVTYENGTVRTLYEGECGSTREVAGYDYYYLFRMADKPSLYMYHDEGDDGGTIRYGRLDLLEDGTLGFTELYSHNYSSYDGGPESYYQKGVEIDQAKYDSGIQRAQNDTTSILIYSDHCGTFVDNYVAQNGCPAMTVEEATAFLATITQDGAIIQF